MYFINPFLKMSRGIADYINRKKSYTLVIESDDEFKDFNENVKELIETNKKLLKSK